MKFRNPKSSFSKTNKDRSVSKRKTRSIQLETLENRNLFATVTGVVFEDLNGDGVQANDEPGLVGWTVYREARATANGVIDPGELVVTTNQDGVYTVDVGDEISNYFIDVIPPPRSETIVDNFQWEATTRTWRIESVGFAPIGFKKVTFTDLTPVGEENSIVTMAIPPRWDTIEAGNGYAKSMAADANGNYVMTWNDPSTTEERVYFQRFNPDGSSSGNAVLAFSQPLLAPSRRPTPPRVVMSEDGTRFAIGFQARVVMYNGQGAPLSSGTTLSGNVSDLSMDNEGNLVAVFYDAKGTNTGLLSFQRFLKSGALNGKKVLIFDSNNGAGNISVAMAPSGGSFAIAYSDYAIGSFLQRYDGKGAKLGTPIRLSTVAQSVSMAVSPSGTIAVSFVEPLAGGNGYDYENVFRRFQPSGVISGPDTRLLLPSGETVSITMDAAGVISWAAVNYRGVSGTIGTPASYRHNILVGRVYPDGSSSEQITANAPWEGAQKGPSIINLGSGELLVSWMERVTDPRTSIMTQRFSVGAPARLASTSSVDSFFSAPMIEDSLLESSDPLKKKRAGAR